MRSQAFLLLSAALGFGTGAIAQLPDDSFDYSDELQEIREDVRLASRLGAFEENVSEADTADAAGVRLRSRHLIFGMPRLIDTRYADAQGLPAVSLLVREGFVVGYADALHCPIWVSQRWTADELRDHGRTPSLERDWSDDPELPAALRIGTSYTGNTTGLDRGHMARHDMNRAWGLDASIAGCLMTNSVPQHRDINRGRAWRNMEDAIRDRVEAAGVDGDSPALWVITGGLFRDANNPPSEAADADLKKAATITTGYRVPYAVYKIVAWFNGDGSFEARGYLFEQAYIVPQGQKLKASHFSIPSQNQHPQKFLVSVDAIESRAGVNFFPRLKDSLESSLEASTPHAMWAAHE